MRTQIKNPFIVGDWIKRDEDFIGRESLIKKYLQLENNSYWLIGARRMGKTSLLRYLQRQFKKQANMLPLFWDVSGANTAYDLKLSFLDALEEAEDDFFDRQISLVIEECEELSLLSILRFIIRSCQKQCLKLILLIDEAEALFKVANTDSRFFDRLKSTILNKTNTFTIIASNHGLQPADPLDFSFTAASFLQTFVPPDYLTRWSKDEAKKLIQKCSENPAIVDEIINHSGCLPFLVQIVCFYHFLTGDLTGALLKINQDNFLDLFFRDDFNNFDSIDTNILIDICFQGEIFLENISKAVHLSRSKIQQRISNLKKLGFISVKENGNYFLSNRFLSDWIKANFVSKVEKNNQFTNDIKKSDISKLILKLSEDSIHLLHYVNSKLADEAQIPFTYNYEKSDFSNIYSIKRTGQELFYRIFASSQAQAIYKTFSNSTNRQLILNQNNLLHLSLPVNFLHDGSQFLCLKHITFKTNNSVDINLTSNVLSIEPINILLIASNTPPSIPLVDNEIMLLKNKIQKAARENDLKIKIKQVLSHEACYQTIINLILSGDFQLIHYAGHFGFDAQTGQGCFYFWEQLSQKGRVVKLDIKKLEEILPAELRLFFLNGCNSAQQSLNNTILNVNSQMNTLLANKSQAFIGNVNFVDDRLSAEFASEFYWNLFAQAGDVVNALFQTRQQFSERTFYEESEFLFWLLPALYINK